LDRPRHSRNKRLSRWALFSEPLLSWGILGALTFLGLVIFSVPLVAVKSLAASGITLRHRLNPRLPTHADTQRLRMFFSLFYCAVHDSQAFQFRKRLVMDRARDVRITA
jgi:hypothetical protein